METERRQRNRRINTCLECRRLKRRCSKTQPCTHCQKTARECVFPVTYTPSRHPGTLSNPELLVQGLHSAAEPASEYELQDDFSAGIVPPDMCLRIGKLSITERIGGMPRLNVANEIDEMLDSISYVSDDLGDNELSAPLSAWFKPHAVLPSIYSSPSLDEEITLSEPEQQVLVDRFFVAVYPVCPLVFPPDLDSTRSVALPIRYAVMFAAAVSLPILDSQSLFQLSKTSLVRMLHDAALNAIRRTDPITRLDLGMFQAVLIYLTPHFLTEISRSHSIHLGAFTRHFQLAGFREDSEKDSNLTRQLKRHMWQHLLFLNQRAVEGTGPDKAIIDDHISLVPSPIDRANRADMLAIVRYECYGIHRWVVRERARVREGSITLIECLDMLESSIAQLQTRHLDSLDHKDPLQKYISCVARLLLGRTRGMVLHGVNANWDDWNKALTAEELRDRAIRSNLDVLEAGVALETDPDLAPWAWYAGAYHQYHSILFPLSQVCVSPHLPDSERIMVMADYVFGQSDLSSPQKRAVMIMRAIKDNLRSFSAMLQSNNTPKSLSLVLSTVRHDGHDHSTDISNVFGPSISTKNSCEASSAKDQHFSGVSLLQAEFSTSDEDESGVWWRWNPDLMDINLGLEWDESIL